MPENSNKSSQKSKNDPKEQRRRRGRQQTATASVEKKIENEPKPPKITESEKPAYEPPGPEFYKSLKRETDDILKITEEANAKYKKKEIQSNWAKYEMPLDTYDEIDEQENLGADYEALIQAPLSIGGHFQFKHEKSWDINTGPSIYDKYFDINMENLNLALCSIPFYERNNIDIIIFNESDIQNMNHRANNFKFKQGYYNDKYVPPELEAKEKNLKSLKSNNIQTEKRKKSDEYNIEILNQDMNHEKLKQFNDIDLEQLKPKSRDLSEAIIDSNKNNLVSEKVTQTHELKDPKLVEDKGVDIEREKLEQKVIDNDFDEIEKELTATKPSMQIKLNTEKEKKIVETQTKKIIKEVEEVPQVTPQDEDFPKNPVIESPEDLEKWLDDFLDG